MGAEHSGFDQINRDDLANEGRPAPEVIGTEQSLTGLINVTEEAEKQLYTAKEFLKKIEETVSSEETLSPDTKSKLLLLENDLRQSITEWQTLAKVLELSTVGSDQGTNTIENNNNLEISNEGTRPLKDFPFVYNHYLELQKSGKVTNLKIEELKKETGNDVEFLLTGQIKQEDSKNKTENIELRFINTAAEEVNQVENATETRASDIDLKLVIEAYKAKLAELESGETKLSDKEKKKLVMETYTEMLKAHLIEQRANSGPIGKTVEKIAKSWDRMPEWGRTALTYAISSTAALSSGKYFNFISSEWSGVATKVLARTVIGTVAKSAIESGIEYVFRLKIKDRAQKMMNHINQTVTQIPIFRKENRNSTHDRSGLNQEPDFAYDYVTSDSPEEEQEIESYIDPELRTKLEEVLAKEVKSRTELQKWLTDTAQYFKYVSDTASIGTAFFLGGAYVGAATAGGKVLARGLDYCLKKQIKCNEDSIKGQRKNISLLERIDEENMSTTIDDTVLEAELKNLLPEMKNKLGKVITLERLRNILTVLDKTLSEFGILGAKSLTNMSLGSVVKKAEAVEGITLKGLAKDHVASDPKTFSRAGKVTAEQAREKKKEKFEKVEKELLLVKHKYLTELDNVQYEIFRTNYEIQKLKDTNDAESSPDLASLTTQLEIYKTKEKELKEDLKRLEDKASNLEMASMSPSERKKYLKEKYIKKESIKKITQRIATWEQLVNYCETQLNEIQLDQANQAEIEKLQADINNFKALIKRGYSEINKIEGVSDEEAELKEQRKKHKKELQAKLYNLKLERGNGASDLALAA